jgi:hypothetical protein
MMANLPLIQAILKQAFRLPLTARDRAQLRRTHAPRPIAGRIRITPKQIKAAGPPRAYSQAQIDDLAYPPLKSTKGHAAR